MSLRRPLAVAGLVATLLACSPPPEAPDGLHESTTYLMRNFHADDATLQTGFDSFLAWFDTEGNALLGVAADDSNTDAFQLGDLTWDDIGHLPLDRDIVIDGKNAVIGERDLSRAKGVISVAELDCTLAEAEDLLVRGDQDVVFSKDWESYDRNYVSDRGAFQNAWTNRAFAPITETVDRYDSSFDADVFAPSMLFTENMADPSPVLFADLEAYPLALEFRHGMYDVGGEPTGGLAIMSFNKEAVWGKAGKSGLLQSFSIELMVERPNNKTLRALAIWAEPHGGGIEPDSAFALNFAVNKSLKSSDRLSDICSGKLDIDSER